MSASRLRPLALWPCNKLHDVVFGDLHLLQRANRLAVTQYRGAVGDSDKLSYSVRHNEDCASVACQGTHLGEKSFGCLVIKGSGTFIKN